MSTPVISESKLREVWNRKESPWLCLDEDSRRQLLSPAKAGTARGRMLVMLREEGNLILGQPVLTREIKFGHLLATSRRSLQRILTLSVLHHQTGESCWGRRGVEELMALAEFEDWHVGHFLDVAEACTAAALGLNWLHDLLGVEQKRKVREAIWQKALRHSLPEDGYVHWWVSSDNNWNQVCHAGMVLGALVAGDQEPDLARRIIQRAVENIGSAASVYAPDGAYPEGPTYWAYGTTYHVLLAAGLESALGHDAGVTAFPGFWESAAYMQQVTTPSGRFYNYSDCRSPRPLMPALLWFARQRNQPAWAEQELQIMMEQRPRDLEARFYALGLIWMPEELPGTNPTQTAPLAWSADGPNPIAVMRRSWTDPGGVFAAIKGGSCSINHGHADVGAFFLEWGGLTWASELGMPEYSQLLVNKVDLWNRGQDSDRWKVLHCRVQTHNVLLFDQATPRVEARAEIVEKDLDSTEPSVTVDLSALFPGKHCGHRRRLTLGLDEVVKVVDELQGLRAGTELIWNMLTPARPEIVGEELWLHQEGKILRLIARDRLDSRWNIFPLDELRQPFDVVNVEGNLDQGWIVQRVFAPLPPEVVLKMELRLGLS
ncbi:MAG: hypothetical protein HC904_06145 [Blastochloris sp.]|nr:hypothetical protein [Blastochloris sp.]